MTDRTLAAIVLAAGESTRFGATKQLARLDGEPLCLRAIRSAEAICGPRTVLVTGHDRAAVASACEPLAGFMVFNPDYRLGLSSSLAAGVRAIRDVSDAVLIMLADQPMISVEHLSTLAATWSASSDSIVASGYADTAGPPVVFPKRFYAALLSMEGDRGAKGVIADNAGHAIVVECAEAAVDVDRPGDLEKL